jgi:hypothetical protein
MGRTKLLQELRKMRFEEAYEGWNAGRLSQFELPICWAYVSARPAVSGTGQDRRPDRRWLEQVTSSTSIPGIAATAARAAIRGFDAAARRELGRDRQAITTNFVIAY